MNEQFGREWFDRFWGTTALMIVCLALTLELRACLAQS